ncbi:MAG: hypothetical protein NUW37_01615 [Planctomycetes bacterium]|nr:hypothetical protein [Planctomycetota bacterium]
MIRKTLFTFALLFLLLTSSCRTVDARFWGFFVIDQNLRFGLQGQGEAVLAVMMLPFACIAELFLYPGEFLHDAVVVFSPQRQPPSWMKSQIDDIPNSSGYIFLDGRPRKVFWTGDVYPKPIK